MAACASPIVRSTTGTAGCPLWHSPPRCTSRSVTAAVPTLSGGCVGGSRFASVAGRSTDARSAASSWAAAWAAGESPSAGTCCRCCCSDCCALAAGRLSSKATRAMLVAPAAAAAGGGRRDRGAMGAALAGWGCSARSQLPRDEGGWRRGLEAWLFGCRTSHKPSLVHPGSTQALSRLPSFGRSKETRASTRRER